MNRLIRLKGEPNERACKLHNDPIVQQEEIIGGYPEAMQDMYLRTLREIKCLLVIQIIIVLLAVLFKKG